MNECPTCSHTIEFHETHCSRCDEFVGYPTRRTAEQEDNLRALSERHDQALQNFRDRDLGDLPDVLSDVTKAARPTISMPFNACDNILRGEKYRNYHQEVAINRRSLAQPDDHGNRDMVGSKLFPAFHQHVAYAVLSPDGTGPTSYGSVAVRWEVDSRYLGQRIVLLEQNSYHFFETHELGHIEAREPPGYRAIWEDRCKLSIAKLESLLTPSTSHDDIPNILLQKGTDRQTDEFIEVAIYAANGLDAQDVNKITVQRPFSTNEEEKCYGRIESVCRERGIEFHDMRTSEHAS